MACEQLTRLGDVIELEDVKREPISSRDRKDRKGSYPYYGAQGIVDYLDDYTYEEITYWLLKMGKILGVARILLRMRLLENSE